MAGENQKKFLAVLVLLVTFVLPIKTDEEKCLIMTYKKYYMLLSNVTKSTINSYSDYLERSKS